MADENKGLVAAGASLVWRRQRVLWWVFAVNLAIGLLGAAGARSQLNKLLQYSLAGEGLAKGFNFGMFMELVSRPNADLMRSSQSSLLFALLFPLFMIFAAGGILAVYREDRKFTAADFCCVGRILLAICALRCFRGSVRDSGRDVSGGKQALSDYIGDRSVSAQTGFYILLAGCIVKSSCLCCSSDSGSTLRKRAWWDEHRMWPNLWKTLGISWHQSPTLFRVYLCISGVAWITLAGGLFLWSKLPPTATPVSFLLLEFIILLQLLTRCGSMTISAWINAAAFPADTVEFTTQVPLEIDETSADVAVDEPDASRTGSEARPPSEKENPQS